MNTVQKDAMLRNLNNALDLAIAGAILKNLKRGILNGEVGPIELGGASIYLRKVSSDIPNSTPIRNMAVRARTKVLLIELKARTLLSIELVGVLIWGQENNAAIWTSGCENFQVESIEAVRALTDSVVATYTQ